MNSKFRLKALLKKVPKHSRVLRDPELMHPIREWAIGLGVAFVILTATAGLGTYTYIKNQFVETESPVESVATVVYRERIVKEVLKEMEARANKISNTPTTPLEVTSQNEAPQETGTSTEETVVVPEKKPIAPALGDG